MISAPLAKPLDFPVRRQAAAQPAPSMPWSMRIAQRLQRRRQADAACLIH